MPALSYDNLALSWSLESRADRFFKLLTVIVLAVALGLAFILSTIEVPVQDRQARKKIPPRIVEFLLEKKKAEPKIEKPPPEPKPKPKPKPKPEPKVEKVKKPEVERKPLTETQQKAREKASQSGILALSNELSDLMDTDDISAMVGGSVSKAEVDTATSSAGDEALLSGSAKGSAGVSDNQVAIVTGKSINLQRNVTSVEQSLVTGKPPATKASEITATAKADSKRKSGVRSEESVTLVFDRNKSKLFALYNRARRKNPNLEGKVILELTIAPSGKVTRIIIVTSELNDKSLESRLVKRIKQFDFGAQAVEQVTVTYPVEFLPS